MKRVCTPCSLVRERERERERERKREKRRERKREREREGEGERKRERELHARASRKCGRAKRSSFSQSKCGIFILINTIN